MDQDSQRLFNAIVILGAALVSGCGSGTTTSSDPVPDAGYKDGAVGVSLDSDGGTTDAGWTGW